MEACVAVVRGGVEKAHIIDGRKHHAILLELLTTEGIGRHYSIFLISFSKKLYRSSKIFVLTNPVVGNNIPLDRY